MEDGKVLRRRKLELRNELDDISRGEKSDNIVTRFFAMEEVEKATSFFVYVSFRSEVITRDLLRTLLHQGKRVCVPLTLVEEKRMEAFWIRDYPGDLEPGYCGILEPSFSLRKSYRANPCDIEVVVVPGSVFDESGGRFGYGGGYYDRFLAKIPEALRIGLAFDLQVVPVAPLKEHDQSLDYVLTEERIICGKKR